MGSRTCLCVEVGESSRVTIAWAGSCAVLRAMFLKVREFGDVMLCLKMDSSRLCQKSYCLHLQVKQSKKRKW